MNKMRFTLNQKGVSDLMKSSGMQKILTDKAKDICDRCGQGYITDIYVGKKRANAMISAKSIKARKDNSKNNTLLKAVH